MLNAVTLKIDEFGLGKAFDDGDVQTVPFPPASLLPQHCFLTPGQLSPGEQNPFWLMKPTVPRNAQNAYGTVCVTARVHSSQLQLQ
ncbi:uncharacterized [Tachysurus ichikawai]